MEMMRPVVKNLDALVSSVQALQWFKDKKMMMMEVLPDIYRVRTSHQTLRQVLPLNSLINYILPPC